MSDLKLCQGPDCHTYHTQDRFKGTKPNKTYQTRRRSSFYYGGGNFCDMHGLKITIIIGEVKPINILIGDQLIK